VFSVLMRRIPATRCVAVLLVSACASRAADEPEAPAPEPVAARPEPTIPRESARDTGPAPLPDDARIELARGACYGPCPIYRVVLTADGEVRWHGERHVATLGDATAKIPVAAFSQLWQAVAAAPFGILPDDERADHPVCPHVFSDSPTVVVTLTGTGVDARVVDYHGTDCAPLTAFRELEAQIDEVAGTRPWIGER
jgi:Domain of unknown function (DUF6438)